VRAIHSRYCWHKVSLRENTKNILGDANYNNYSHLTTEAGASSAIPAMVLDYQRFQYLLDPKRGLHSFIAM